MFLVSCVAGLVAAYGILLLDASGVDYQMGLQFLVVVFLLNLLDLSMPYGETMPVDSAMVVACLVLAGPLTAAAVTVIARVAVDLARGGSTGMDRTLSLLSRRLVALAACAYLLAVLPEQVAPSYVVYVEGLLAGLTFVFLELLLAQVQAAPRLRERFSQLVVGNLILQGPLLAAQVSVAVLTVITYGQMNVWALAVMTLLVVLMRESLALFLAIRQAYRSTIEALVATIEAQDPGRKGHAERVESIARSIALRLGVRGGSLETLGYAALLHDVDMLGLDVDDVAQVVQKHSADTVLSVRFLADVVPVLRLCDGSEMAEPPPWSIQQSAAVVALASDMDDQANVVNWAEKTGAVARLSEQVDRRAVSVAKDAAKFAVRLGRVAD